MGLKKEDYESLFCCIQSDQVPLSDVVEFMKDEDFKRWYKSRLNGGGQYP